MKCRTTTSSAAAAALATVLAATMARLPRRAYVTAFLLSACLPACHAPGAAATPAAASRRAGDTLVVATYAYPGLDRLGAVAPLARHLDRTLARPVKATTLPDPGALARALREGDVDVAVLNTFGYLIVAGSGAGVATPVATFRIAAGERSNYAAAIAAGASVESVEELVPRAATLRLALVSAGSTTGNLIPRLQLARVGLHDPERQFRSVAYAGTHANAMAMLQRGEVDVARLAVEEYERQAATGDSTRLTTRVVWRSPDIVLGPLVVRAALDGALRERIAASLVGLERSAPEAFAALRGGWVEARRADALVPATDRTYDEVRALMGDSPEAKAIVARFAR